MESRTSASHPFGFVKIVEFRFRITAMTFGHRNLLEPSAQPTHALFSGFIVSQRTLYSEPVKTRRKALQFRGLKKR